MWMLEAVQEHGADVVHGAATGHGAAEGEAFNAGETIIHHIANTTEHPVIHLPKVLGIDFSVSKHVVMLWLVAFIVFALITWIVRRYLKHLDRDPVPLGSENALEFVVVWVRDSIVEPNVGKKWVNTWAPLILTFFAFIFTANLIGLIPIFETLNLINHWIVHAKPDTVFGRLLNGGTTATANFNVTAGLALVTFTAIIIAGSKAHGFFQHWKNIVPPGMAWPLYILLIPIEILGMLVKPFALTMRLAANMTGGHMAILLVLSLVMLFAEMFNAWIGIAVAPVSVVLAVGISGLELIVVLVQAYVFTLLTAVFIGLVIHVHH